MFHPLPTLAQTDTPEQANGSETAPAPDANETPPVESGTDSVGSVLEDVSKGDYTSLLAVVEAYLLPALLVLLVLIVAYFLGKFLGRVAGGAVGKRIDTTLGKFLRKLVFYSILVFALLGVLGYFGISVASFAAVLAAAGFAIGLAFQGTLSNFAAGIMLLTFRPFRVGQVVKINDEMGIVDEIELFHTTLDTFDKRRIIMPNSQIFGNTIENVSHHPERRVDVNVGVEYSADLDKTREVLSTACESLKEKMIEGEGRGYQIYLWELGNSSVNWIVRFWTHGDNYWPVREQLTRAVKMHLDEAGLGIPFPQMDVHLDGKLDGERDKAEQA
ncbi:MAG: mechanosensitive ion channel family protein [Phycisphaeraceae bacterium]